MKSWDNKPYPQKIWSEFINGTDLVKTECFQNSIFYNRMENTITLNIDVTMDMHLEQYTEIEKFRELSNEGILRQKSKIVNFAYPLKEKFLFNFKNQELFCSGVTIFNYLSGASIKYNLGEGLFNFCYADFDFQKGEDTFLAVAKNISPIPDELKFVDRLYDRFNFAKDMNAISDIVYSSIYSAAFPVSFNHLTEMAFTDYMCYIKLLQSEFLSLVDFCFDENLYPKVLGAKTPTDRFGIYCDIFKRPSIWTNAEQFFATINNVDYAKLDLITITNEHEELAELSGIAIPELETICYLPHSAEFSYQCNSLLSILQLEFSKMLENGMKLCKCNYCGKYFIVKGNYNGNNCDRITVNNMTCQQLAAIKKHKEKTSDSIAWKIYNKYYKRYFARNKVGSIKDPAFKKWQRNATVMRDECNEGTVSPQDFLIFSHDSFKNRPFKKSLDDVLKDFNQ